jgi:FHA domain
MLPGWGTTCGKCRPHLVPAKTMFLAPGQVALPARAGGGMTLAWLVVIRSIDERQRGTLIELDRARVVLSRAGASRAGGDRVVAFDDGYMSSAHAVVGRPATGNRDDAFTIGDRQNPGSANGTFVNSRKLGAGEVVRLGDGDIVKVGATELLFKSLWLPPVAARQS